jgi:three-Cys-motif partner protein
MLPRFCASLRALDRAVVFLDPFATQVSWSTVVSLAETKKVDCWILFPVAAIARMMPRDDQPSDALATQLDRIFGLRDHWSDFYRQSAQLPMFEPIPGYERLPGSLQIADRYRARLEEVFVSVAPTRRTFRNSHNAPMFELFFGASNPTGAPRAIRMADYILQNW